MALAVIFMIRANVAVAVHVQPIRSIIQPDCIGFISSISIYGSLEFEQDRDLILPVGFLGYRGRFDEPVVSGHTMDVACLGQPDKAAVHDGNNTLLVISGIRPAAVFCGLEFRKTGILHSRLTEAVTERSLQIQLFIGERKTVYFFKIWMIFLVFGRSDSGKLTGSLIAFDLIRQHEVINLPATSKGFRK